MNTIYVDTYYLVVNMWFNMVQQVFMTWSNWNWSKEYTPFGLTENHLDQSKSSGPSDLVQGIHWPLFLLVSGKGCGLWLWHSLDFSLTFFYSGNENIFLSKHKKYIHVYAWRGEATITVNDFQIQVLRDRLHQCLTLSPWTYKCEKKNECEKYHNFSVEKI